MSFLGVNIKKIRTVKNLNQSEFAELFGLSRNVIGAYEEGRAEAKLETIILIARYFNISIDKLICFKLTINDILNFDKKISKIKDINVKNKIPYIKIEELNNFFDNFEKKLYIDKLPTIEIFGFDNTFLAFEFFNDKFKIINDFYDNSILICKKKLLFIDVFYSDSLYLLFFNDKIFIGKLIIKEKMFTFETNNFIEIKLDNNNKYLIFNIEAIIIKNLDKILSLDNQKTIQKINTLINK